GGPSTHGLLGHAEAGLQRIEFGPQDAGQLVAELLEPLDDLRNLRLPLVDVDAQHGFDVGGRDVEAGDVERVRRGYGTDRRFDGSGLSFESLDDPLEYARVLAVSGPQEAAIVAATEPVHVEDRG